MFIFKTTHDKLIAEAFLSGLNHGKVERDRDAEINQRAIDAERAISASLRADIEAMKPIYELGKKRRLQYEKDNAKRKEQRKVKAS